MLTLAQRLAQLADELREADRVFWEFRPQVCFREREGGKPDGKPLHGPFVPRERIDWRDGQAYLVRDGWPDSPALNPPALESVERYIEAHRRLWDIAEQGESLLAEAGENLPDGDGSTPEGRILFWALGSVIPRMRLAAVCRVSAFATVAGKLKVIIAHLGTAEDDDENWSEADRPGQFLKIVKHKLKRTTFYAYLKNGTIKKRPAGKGFIQVWLPDFNKFK